MSYQPQQPPPYGGVPGPQGMPPQGYGVPAPAPAPMAAPAAAGSRGKGLTLLGVAVLVVGLIAGVALFAMSGSTKEDTIKKFARAPVGCTTTLQFDSSGTYTFYIETKGSMPALGGDCAGSGGSYDRGDDDLPLPTLSLVGPGGTEVTLTPSSAYSYDAGGFVGTATKEAAISAAGAYELTVTADSTDFAIAVGGDPEADSSTMQTIGIAAAAAGVVLGGLLLFLGMRAKRSTPPSAPAATWQQGSAPAPGWQGVPGAQPAPGYQPPPQAPAPPYQAPAPPYQPPAPQPPQPPAPPGWGAPQG